MSTSNTNPPNTAKKYSPFTGVLALAILMLLGLATTLPGFAQTTVAATHQYQASLRAFSIARMQSMMAHDYERPSRVTSNLPSMMLFSPDGKMLVNAIDDASLADLERQLPPRANEMGPASEERDWNRPDWDVFEDALIKAAGATPDSLKPSNKDQWTLLLISSDHAACKHCAPFEKAFDAMRKDHSTQLNAIRLLLKSE